MRFARTAALLGVALLYVALGPWVLVAAAGSLLVPRVRRWWRPTRRAALAWAGAGVVAVLLVVLVPGGWLPVPPGPGTLVTPSYVGRPVVADPVTARLPDGHLGPGPLGESPDVDTAWHRLEGCAAPQVDSHRRLVTVCGGSAPTLRVVDPESLHPLATKALPVGERCGSAPFYLDGGEHVVVATATRRVVVVGTQDADDVADLTTEGGVDLAPVVAAGDCVVAMDPAPGGRTWWVTRDGVVGTLQPASGGVRVLDLGEPVAGSVVATADGGAYVATADAAYRLRADRAGRPTVAWRVAYDGTGGGASPVLLPGGRVAVTRTAGAAAEVVVLDDADGSVVCAGPVGALTDTSLEAVGTAGVVVRGREVREGLSSLAGSLLRWPADSVLTRVDAVSGRCEVTWTTDGLHPTSAPELSRTTGLLYATSERRSRWGVSAAYLTALDSRTGRTAFAVRIGLGTLGPGGSAGGAGGADGRASVVLAPDGAAYVATRAGLVRVRDSG